MLGKLMKYEMKCCARSFVPLYVALLVFSLISGAFMGIEETYSYAIIYFIMFVGAIGLFIATIVLTITVTIQRFNTSLLGDEGYLMFTLPVSEKQLVLSKLLSAIIYLICTVLVSTISIIIFLGIFNFKFDMISFDVIKESLGEIISSTGWLWVQSIISDSIGYVNLILSIYLAVTIGHLPKFSSKKVLAGIMAFVVINIVDSVISIGLSYIIGGADPISLAVLEGLAESQFAGIDAAELNVNISGANIAMIIEQIIFCVALFFGTTKLLEKKLNLE